MMMWFAVIIAVLIGIGVVIEVLARIAILRITGSLDEWED